MVHRMLNQEEDEEMKAFILRCKTNLQEIREEKIERTTFTVSDEKE
jgi:hypothetical protein